MAAAASRISSWVGVLAQLRRVDKENLGRLVLVEHAAAAQSVQSGPTNGMVDGAGVHRPRKADKPPGAVACRICASRLGHRSS